MVGKLEIRDMVFYGYHGVHKEERFAGGKFVVSCSFKYQIPDGVVIKELDQTIDYQKVFETVESVMQKPVDLIEDLAQQVINALKEKFHQIEELTVRVEKHSPPIKGMGLTAFELNWNK